MQQIGLNDRAADIWKPLLAVASLAALDAAVVHGLERLAQETGGDPEIAEDARRLSIAATLAAEVAEWPDQRFVGMTSELVVLLEGAGVMVTDLDLHRLLVEWGFNQKSARTADRDPSFMAP